MKHLAVFAPMALIAVSCLSHSTPAHADSFHLTASGSGITVDATLTGVADPFVAGAFDLTGGTGFVSGVPLTLVAPSGTSQTAETLNFTSPPFQYDGSYSYNNVIYTEGYSGNGLLLDANGLLFSEPGDFLNLFAQGAYSFADNEIISGSSSPFDSLTITRVAATPEPSSVALLGSGLLGVAGLLRRRFAPVR